MFDDVVAPGRGDHLLVVDVDQTGELLDRRPVAPELIGVNELWDVVFTQQPGQERLRGLGVAVALQQNFEHEAVLVYRSPKPMANTVHARTHLVEMPPGTPTGFPVTQSFSEEGAEFDTPFAEGFMADLDAALVQQFLDISVAERKMVVQSDRVLDDRHRETVAVGLGVGHEQSAYPNPVKATQPSGLTAYESRK